MAVSHKNLSRWYLTTGQGMEAGLTLTQAVAGASAVPPRDGQSMIVKLEAGLSVDQVLSEAPKWLPQADRFLLFAAASSGRLPDILGKLSEKHKLATENVMKAVVVTLYPLGVIHFAIFLLPVMTLFEFREDGGVHLNAGGYLAEVLTFLIPLWLILGAIIILASSQSPILRLTMNLIPGLRGYRKARAMADFFYALEALLLAGTRMDEAWYGAGPVSGEPKIEKASLAMTERIRTGEPPGRHLIDHRCFPSDFISLYQTGEQTGRLDVNLAGLARQYQERATGKMAMASFLYPKLIFLVIAAVVAVKVMSFYYQTSIKPVMDLLE